MSAHQIERAPLSSLQADESNARVHDERNLAAITDSLRQFGQVEPLVIQKSSGRVVGGNGRLEAMRQLGWTEADVVRLDLSDTKATALGIALNRTSDLAEWDEDALAQLLSGIKDEVDVATLGFDEDELTQLLESSVQEDEGEGQGFGLPPDYQEPVRFSEQAPQPQPQPAPQVASASGQSSPSSPSVPEPDPTAPSPVRHMAGATEATGNGQMVKFSLDPADAEELHALVDEAQEALKIEGFGETLLAVMRLWVEQLPKRSA